MKSQTNERFWKCYADMPKEIKQQAREAYVLFEKDPYYPRLHFKRIHSTRPVFSARITGKKICREDRNVFGKNVILTRFLDPFDFRPQAGQFLLQGFIPPVQVIDPGDYRGPLGP